jgi:hypothetical protein
MCLIIRCEPRARATRAITRVADEEAGAGGGWRARGGMG